MKSEIFHRSLVCCLLVTLLPTVARSQISALKKVAESLEPAKAATSEKPADARTRLAQWQQDARNALSRLEAPAAATTLPQGVSAAEFNDRCNDLGQVILITTSALKSFTAVEDARKALAESRAEEAAWTGFKKKPPYSLLMLDDLLNQRDAIEANISSYESSLSIHERLLGSIMAQTKVAEDNENSALGEVQKANSDTSEAAKWRLESAHVRSRLLAVRAGLTQNMISSLKDRMAGAKSDLALLERQVKAVKASSHFSDDDLAKINKSSEERKQSIRKELDGVAKRLKTAMTTRAQAQAAVDALNAAAAAEEPPGLELAKYRLDVAESRVDALQTLTEGLESLLQLEDVVVKAYQDRRTLIEATSPQQRSKMLESLGVPRERLWAWENVLEDELSSGNAELGKLEARAAAISSDDPRYSLINEQRAHTSEKIAMIQRLEQAVAAQRKLVKRWVIEHTPTADKPGYYERFSMLATTAWQAVKKIWSFEVMRYEDKVEVDGQTISGKIPITLGTLLRAVLFFLIGYWIAARIASHLQAGLVSRGHIAEAQAKTLRNWGMIVVSLFLVIGTLSFLKIPLTVFAFFGGALAIGLGFGSQTLIKNFISGIIVLAERKVRVGDLVDVDGVVGTVAEINTRSSVVRSGDDMETMIPNSVFLENRVTNWTLSSARVRRSLRVSVAYNTSPPQVMALLTEVAGRHGLICKEPVPFAVFEDFGENALVFGLYFWLELRGGTNPMIVSSDLRLMLEKRFAEVGISLPFPQRDVHLTSDKPLDVQWVGPPPPPPP